ncbi:MAG: Trigger factor [Candidatus Nomurabacteria bacterium GW2011_GWF2_43_8]|uniref:Trigger factor n=3 Tax=Candidatus Nomuraibacteriota TaxID=1752729 RepID=A0A0G1FKC9_9BACT|nr:MAG: Trigger factor [Candidatus Nomurabacteria bacterium GW2011_GWA2_43_15]KKT18811.1 MAG: Trigger factor [Candidatus Nomurabacteria bacterium GW2011_GWB1_43_7]KKT22830.1 MAG: Trigger factor [Candidatus Nomurabacteria bacterium GW2011_GWF2_43_8]
MRVSVKKLPKSEVEIEGELEVELFESYFTKALWKIGENLELPGFRKGKVPENVLLSKIPEVQILEEMAQLALGEHYPKILEDEKIDAISRPEISITKLARKNPLGFKIKTAVLPAIKLPDYKKIAQKVIAGVTDAEKNFEVTEKELKDTILDIRKSRAPKVHMAEHEHKEGETHPEPELPEFNDVFVQTLGPFKDVADFKEKLRENIKLEKQNLQKEKTRLKIIEEIIGKSEMDLPEILVEVELDKILYKMDSDITQMGLKFEDYLKHLNKTKEDLRKEFRTDAEKKAKLSLILNEIAKTEKIVADSDQVAREVAAILEHYKEADPDRARAHAENVLTNEKIFQFLESQ